jgi:amphi-Trp domain-containing protein
MTEIESKQEMTRSEVAEYLRAFAAELDTATADRHPGPDRDASTADRRSGPDRHDESRDGRVTFMIGNDSATINPPERLTFEVEVESDDPLVGSERDHSVAFELAWQTEAVRDDESDPEIEIR